MRNFKVVVQYDGSRYKGWQKQKDNELTVQGKIEDVLEKMAGEKVALIGSERTDVGAHAENYVANFQTDSSFSQEMLLDYFYEYLPEDIVVKSVEEVHERFHARYNVKSKTYVYTINNRKQRNVFERKYQYHVETKLNLEDMRKAAEILEGTHDFQSFTSLKSDAKSTVRTIEYIQITEKDGIVEIKVKANDFLWHMPRLIIGMLIGVGTGDVKIAKVQTVLDEAKKQERAPIAKAKALSLVNVEY
ncbi:MAG: tRNA pseudouridine(38-40) synthase TruA [Cellulosilyticaceae bacterium]